MPPVVCGALVRLELRKTMTLEQIAEDEETAQRFLDAVLAPTDEEIQLAIEDAAANPPTPEEQATLDRVTEKLKRL